MRTTLFSKRGNVVATALIVVALLVSAGVMLQRELYPVRQSDLHKTMSAFEENVYSTPVALLQEYAMHGYQNGSDNWWFCVNRPSAPNLSRTTNDFTTFATADLMGKLESLTKEYPEFNITVGSPSFELEAPLIIQDLNDNITVINITNLTITVQDGDRLIQKSLNQEEAYKLHFWLLYKGLQGWTTCDSAGMYASFDKTFQTKSCAFFKDTCICAEGEGDNGNCCTGPYPNQEDCTGANPKKIQDFATSERNQLMATSGVKEEDVQDAADLMADDLTRIFNGEARTWCGQSIKYPTTGIKCTATIENPRLQNDFYSSYAYHNTGCLFQCQPTCGITTISAFDSFVCAGNAIPGMSGPSCTITATDPPLSGCGGAISYALHNPSKQSELLGKISIAAAQTCTRGADGIIRCGDYEIGNDTEFNPMSMCALDPLRSSRGTEGPWKETPATANCNPAPEGAVGLPDVPNSAYTIGDTKVKCLKDDSKGSNGKWFGTDGWIDKKGTADITITCQDPGLDTKPIQAQIRMRVAFRHACRQAMRYRAIAPPSCKAPGADGDKSCADIDCNTGNPCYRKHCEMVDNAAGGKSPKCVADDTQPTTCIDEDNPCKQGTCVSNVCHLEGDYGTPISENAPCGNARTGSYYCETCQSGVCTPVTTTTTCQPWPPKQCYTGVCSGGSCTPELNPSATCSCGTCCSCSCADPNDKTPTSCSGTATVPHDCDPSHDTQEPYTCEPSAGGYNCEAPTGQRPAGCCGVVLCPAGKDCHCGFCDTPGSPCTS